MFKKIDNLDMVVSDAMSKCAEQPVVHNLLLQYRFPISLIREPFTKDIREKARAWQNPQKHASLHMNHGMFIHANGNGIDHIVKELKRKADSNRALYSLISMQQIVGSGDLPIPSFLILQFSTVKNRLYCTAYFRALEVSCFLPINIAEMCFVMEHIRPHFSEIEEVWLCIHAFHAHCKRNFDCLEKSQLDQQEPGAIGACLLDKNMKDTVKVWLTSEMRESTVIETSRLEEICNFLKRTHALTGTIYSDEFLREVEEAKNALVGLKALRENSSYSTDIQVRTEEFREHLRKAIAAM